MERMTFLNGDDIPVVNNDNCYEEQSEHYCGPAIDRLAAYEDTGLEPEICAEYKKFEDEAIGKGVPFSRIVELMEADKEGRISVLPNKKGHTWEKCGGCEHFEREPGKKCGTCEVGRYEGVVLYQSHKACAADFVPGSNTAPKGDVYESNL